ncbi:thioredoxin [Peptoniphilus sp. ING2-D1G]|nr:thioredoxin [Peptoniphilus sp. ING2-D1G]
MNIIKGYEHLQEIISKEKFVLIFGLVNSCSVCSVDYPHIEELSNRYYISLYSVDLEKEAEIRGQLEIFTAPVVMLFYNGRLYHKQARIIDFKELENRIKEVLL